MGGGARGNAGDGRGLRDTRGAAEPARRERRAQYREGSLGRDASEATWQRSGRPVSWPRRSSRLLTQAGQTVATAESLTGGLVAAALTDVPGASNAFRGGVVAYATELKAQAARRGRRACSSGTARSTPRWPPRWPTACRDRLGATIGVATTGVAGPDPQDGHPAGTVHIAVSLADDTVVRTMALPGNRDEVRRLTVERVLGLLLGRLREECP